MKNSNQCPKCQSKRVLKRRGSAVLNSWFRIAVSITSLDIWISKFICLDCGFMEEWIENKEDLERLSTKLDTPGF